MFGSLVDIRVDVTNFALITHSVPAERVQRLLPERYELQTFGPPGAETCFVTATCFCNKDFRPRLAGHPRHSFDESTYRTYVRVGEDLGVYFFGRYLGTALAFASQRPFARDTYRADFEVSTESSIDGYRLYSCHAESSAGTTSFSISAADIPTEKGPFESGYQMEQFLTYRLHGYFTSSMGMQGHMPVDHPRMEAFEGRLDGGRFDLWERLGILEPDEAGSPFSVLVVKEVPFILHPPRPL